MENVYLWLYNYAGIFSQESSDAEQILCNYHLNFLIFQYYYHYILIIFIIIKQASASKIFHLPSSPILKNITNIVLLVKNFRCLISNLELRLPERFHLIIRDYKAQY